MVREIKTSLIQCEITSDREEMNSRIENMIKEAALLSPDIIVLPERWRPIPKPDKLMEAIEKERGSDYDLIKKLSKEYSIDIISGGIWEYRVESQQKKAFITSYYFENGEETGKQDKLHLYSYEPTVFQPGSQLNIFTHHKTGTKFSILICFDVAFFETPRLSVENGAEILISPTLIREDGIYNWNIYLQARALENRIPIVACNPVGTFHERHFSGNSKIISFKTGYESPSILVVNELDKDKPGILTENVNVSYPNKIRKKRLDEKIENPYVQHVK